jgi:hypothetical protein
VAKPGNVTKRNAVAKQWTGKYFHLLRLRKAVNQAVRKLKSKRAQRQLRVALRIIAAQGHQTLEDLHISGILNTGDVL